MSEGVVLDVSGPKQLRLTHLLPIRNDEGCRGAGDQDHRTQVWTWGGPEPQASKRAPRSSSFKAGEEGEGLDPHLGPGWAWELAGREREGTGFHFPG